MRCPECNVNNAEDAGFCGSCGLLLIKARQALEEQKPKRRSEDFASQKRRSADQTIAHCEFCNGQVPLNTLKCQHCGEILNEEFHRERARRIRARFNYASWVAYLFGLAALLVFRPVGLVSIAAGLMLSIVYYAIPADPAALRKSSKESGLFHFLTAQARLERVTMPVPRFPKRKLVFVGTPLIAALVGYGANFFLLQKPMNNVLEENEAFAGMTVSAHFKYWIIPGIVEYDLQSVGAQQTPLDVHTALLEYAKRLRVRQFSRVDLSYQGATKFSIAGDDFRRVGNEYAKKNFEFVLYKFPGLLHTERAAPAASGSAGRDALLRFHQQWYGPDQLTRQSIVGR